MTASHTIRAIHEQEWREVRDLRLRALRDPAAALAFAESYDAAAMRPDDFWKERAKGSSFEAGTEATVRQFVAVSDDGEWLGTVVALHEDAGAEDFEGRTIARDGAHIVGVYLDPAHRGGGLIQRLFQEALVWLRKSGRVYVRLYVHEDNARARRAYLSCGFHDTGLVIEGSLGREVEMARDVP